MKKIFILLIALNINLIVFSEENNSLISDFVNNKNQTENTENNSLISDFVNNKNQAENTENNLNESDLSKEYEKLTQKVAEQIQNNTNNCLNLIPSENYLHIGKPVLSISTNDSEEKIKRILNDELKTTCNSWHESMKCSIIPPYNSEIFNYFEKENKRLLNFIYLRLLLAGDCYVQEFSKIVLSDCLSKNDSTLITAEENQKLNKYGSCADNLENKLKINNFQSSYTEYWNKLKQCYLEAGLSSQCPRIAETDLLVAEWDKENQKCHTQEEINNLKQKEQKLIANINLSKSLYDQEINNLNLLQIQKDKLTEKVDKAQDVVETIMDPIVKIAEKELENLDKQSKKPEIKNTSSKITINKNLFFTIIQKSTEIFINLALLMSDSASDIKAQDLTEPIKKASFWGETLSVAVNGLENGDFTFFDQKVLEAKANISEIYANLSQRDSQSLSQTRKQIQEFEQNICK